MVNIRLENLKERLNRYYEAEEKILTGQEYRIGTRNLRRADLSQVRSAIKDLEIEINRIENKGARRITRIVPRDI